MDQAKGEYLYFMDGDDFVEPTLLATIWRKAKESDAEIVVFSADTYNEQTKKFVGKPYLRFPRSLPQGVFSGMDAKMECFQVTCPWNRLFLREFVTKNQIRWQPTYSANDLLFTCIAMAIATRIVCCDLIRIHYRIGNTTNIQSTKEKQPLDAFLALKELKLELERRERFDEFRIAFENKVLDVVCHQLDTLTTYESLRSFYDAMVTYGIAELGMTNFSRHAFHTTPLETKYKRFCLMRDTPWETFLTEAVPKKSWM